MATKPKQSDKFMHEGEVSSPQCHGCKNWKKGTLTCKAFPDGIPQGILINAIDHTKHIKGDNGIKFEAVE